MVAGFRACLWAIIVRFTAGEPRGKRNRFAVPFSGGAQRFSPDAGESEGRAPPPAEDPVTERSEGDGMRSVGRTSQIATALAVRTGIHRERVDAARVCLYQQLTMIGGDSDRTTGEATGD